MGDALNYGRALHKSDKLFGQRVRDNGFEDIPKQTRADAMWFASLQADRLPVDLAHPTSIHKWHRDHADTLPPSLDLSDRPAPALLNMVQVEPIAR